MRNLSRAEATGVLTLAVLVLVAWYLVFLAPEVAQLHRDRKATHELLFELAKAPSPAAAAPPLVRAASAPLSEPVKQATSAPGPEPRKPGPHKLHGPRRRPDQMRDRGLSECEDSDDPLCGLVRR